MPNPIVGFWILVGCLNHTAAFGYGAYFYDADGNYISVPDQVLSMSNDRKYAYNGNRKYGCNGGYPQADFNVLPNGSYLDTPGPVPKTYICTVAGTWLECAATNNSAYPYKEDGIIRQYCGAGYRDVYIAGLTNDAAKFCSMPYEYFTGTTDNLIPPSSKACEYQANAGEYTRYAYTSCAPGYKYVKYPYSSYKCESCGMVANGKYNITDNHRSGTCTLTCDNGYYASNGQCVYSGTSGGTCPAGKFDMSYYGGADTDCRDCPAGAKCDGVDVFCPVGNYVYTVYDGVTVPQCRRCPGNGMVQTDYNDKLEQCSGDREAWGKGETTDCLWTNYITEYIDDCYEYSGSDTTGIYHFTETNGDWYSCPYQL